MLFWLLSFDAHKNNVQNHLAILMRVSLEEHASIGCCLLEHKQNTTMEKNKNYEIYSFFQE